jgi:geranylgeranyl diphosphate synthase type II
MRYSVFNGGKRLRPLITIAAAEYTGIPVDRIVYSLGAMIEMVHTYSLVHDDLPAMDNDDIRRGKPTVHRMFNEAIAILTGDALLTQAFELMGAIGTYKKNGDLTALLNEFTGALGSKGLVGGQVVDLEKKDVRVSEKDILFIHRNKTAALITFAAIAAPVFFKKQRSIADMRTYGQALGMAFQTGDDIVDYTDDAHEASIVSVLGIDGAKDLFYGYIEQAKKALRQKEEALYLIGICDWIKKGFNL